MRHGADAEHDLEVQAKRHAFAALHEHVRGEPVQLTFIEFEMLALLAGSPGIVFSRRELLERLRGSADYREPRTIDVHIRHLREKIERDPSNPELILTIRGAGYRFASE